MIHDVEHFFADNVDAIAGVVIVLLAALVVVAVYNLANRVVLPRLHRRAEGFAARERARRR